MFRVGIGQDSHRFVKEGDKKLVLAGIVIEGEKGLEANSDGDVMLHALFNALSQAVGQKSLGAYADPMLEKGITDSREYLKVAMRMVEEKGYKVNNVGIMTEAGRPRLHLHEERMKESLSRMLKIEKDRIGLTFTSGEDLTAFGRGEGMQVFAIVSLVKNG